MKLFALHETKNLQEMLEPDTGPDGERIDGKPETQAKYDEMNKRINQVENTAKTMSTNVSSQLKDFEKKMVGDKDLYQKPMSTKGITPQEPSAHLMQPGGTPADRPAAHF